MLSSFLKTSSAVASANSAFKGALKTVIAAQPQEKRNFPCRKDKKFLHLCL